jgi:hypothetical protein
MLDHFATSLAAILASLCAPLHVLVAGKLFASLGASIAGGSTRLADRYCERTLAGNDLACHAAQITAVGAGAERPLVFRLTVAH